MTVVYTKPNCPACSMTIRHLEKRGIAYEALPIDDAIVQRATEAYITAAPIVLVDDIVMWGGYRPDRIDALIS